MDEVVDAPSEQLSLTQSRLGRRLAALAFAGFLLVMVKLAVGLLAGVVVAVLAFPVLDAVIAKLEPASVVHRRQRLGEQLPLALELIAAAIASGAPVVQAVELVAHAIEAPLGDELADVAAHLRLGARSEQAWSRLADSHGVGTDVATATRAVLRAERTGAQLAPSLLRIAADARAESATQRLERAEKAGVMSALPLAMCFLPAFVAVGIVPIVVDSISRFV